MSLVEKFDFMMVLVTESTLLYLFLALSLMLYYLYWWYNSKSDYWDDRGVPCSKKAFFLKAMLNRQSQFELQTEIYRVLGKRPFLGIFQFRNPTFFVRDPELVHRIMVKDFMYFQDRPIPQTNSKGDFFSSSLIGMKGQTWRALRYKLTPTFSTGKLKGMFAQVSNCGDNMIEVIEKFANDGVVVETKMFLFEFTLEVISSCAFGLQYKPGSPEFIEFKSNVQKAFKVNPLLVLKFALLFIYPKLGEKISLSPISADAEQYFVNLIKANMKYRKDNVVKRNDYFQLLLNLKEQEESGKDMGLTATDKNEDDTVVNQMQYTERNEQPSSDEAKLFTDDIICANSLVFLLTATESVANSVSTILFELSQLPDVQRKLQEEVDSELARHGGWDYETIKDMTYLDQVVQEAQRLYPGLHMLSRECVKPYKVAGTDIVLEKGVTVSIPVVMIQRDPQNYPDPEQFKPERYEGNNFKPSAIYMPFGDGPRICIAMRFALMEVKTCVARIMSQYSITLSPKTRFPIEFEARAVFPGIKGGVWLKFEKRKTS